MITKKTFLVPIFKQSVIVIVFDDYEELIKKYPEIKERRFFGLTIENENFDHKIIIPPNNAPIIVHEVEHLKNIILRNIGHIPDNSNDEIDAYLVEYLLKRILRITQMHLDRKK